MDSELVGNVFRLVNIVLALGYLPLLLKRVQYVRRDQVGHALGDGLFTLAVIVGAWSLYNVHFVASQPMVTTALVIWIVNVVRNGRRERHRVRQQREHS